MRNEFVGMAQIILITGGSRSGKSEFAQKMAEKQPGPRLFVATCPVTDDEMAQRIEKHQRQRNASQWRTVEEPAKILRILEQYREYPAILIDCLTLWVNNIMFEAQQCNNTVDEPEISERIKETLAAARKCSGKIIFVTNEVGLGIVPENKEARLYRDLVGRCNQHVGAEADEVYLVSCGVPLQLK